jgi:hypothetical protein
VDASIDRDAVNIRASGSSDVSLHPTGPLAVTEHWWIERIR